MKRLLVIVLFAVILFSFCGCHLLTSDDSENLEFHEDAAYDSEMIDEDDDSFIFTWLSYMEIAVTKDRAKEEYYRKYTDDLFDRMSRIGVTDCFVQVRPFADSLYYSEVYPLSKYAEMAEFDPLRVIEESAKTKNIALHAWINPYRMGEDTSFLSERGIKDTDIITTPSGSYLSPSSLEAQKLILDGVRELLNNYDIRGIHIDDYFYPPDVHSADKTQFSAYKERGGRLEISQWRRENVNNLLKGMYSAVKSFGDDKIFSVSPAGDIDKNINQLYADVELWCREEGYCDIILPQLYFGFDNESLPFEETLSSWLMLADREKVDLVPALALYKVGKEDIYAGEKGKREWQENGDILKRQIQSIKRGGIHSFGLYSASYINFSETFSSQELNNIKSVI